MSMVLHTLQYGWIACPTALIEAFFTWWDREELRRVNRPREEILRELRAGLNGGLEEGAGRGGDLV